MKMITQEYITGHLTGCGDADLHNSLASASSASSEHFHIKQKICVILVIKQLLSILTIIKAEEINYFKAVFHLIIDENMSLRSRRILNLQAFHSYFDNGPGY